MRDLKFETRDGNDYAMWTGQSGDAASAAVERLKQEQPGTWVEFNMAYEAWKAGESKGKPKDKAETDKAAAAKAEAEPYTPKRGR